MSITVSVVPPGPGDGDLPFTDGGPGTEYTPMGEVESMSAFARGLGPRRMKIAIGVFGGLLLLLAVLTALE